MDLSSSLSMPDLSKPKLSIPKLPLPGFGAPKASGGLVIRPGEVELVRMDGKKVASHVRVPLEGTDEEHLTQAIEQAVASAQVKTKRMMMLKGHPQDSTVSATPEEKPDPKELEAKTKRAIMRMNGLFTSASAVPTEDERIREHGGKDQ